jgi:hypothetical protein
VGRRLACGRGLSSAPLKLIDIRSVVDCGMKFNENKKATRGVEPICYIGALLTALLHATV